MEEVVRIMEDLDEGLEPWIDEGICKLEALLEKYQAFHEYTERGPKTL